MRVPWQWVTMPSIPRWNDTALGTFLTEVNRRMKLLENALKYTGDLSYGVRVSPVGSTTPSVGGVRILVTANTGATSITFFNDGEPGQTLIVQAGDTHTTVVNSATLRLRAGANWTPGLHATKQFFTVDGLTWDEV